MNIDRPIFIIGTGRCGSTAFHTLLSYHHQVAWLSGLCTRFPKNLLIHRTALRAMQNRSIEQLLRRFIVPGENYAFWNAYFPGFRRPFRDLLEEDVTPRTKKVIRQVTVDLVVPDRPRLLVKITGWPRIGFLHHIFEDALFIHIKRDGRAVANSMINIGFWHGWEGPSQWRWGPLTPEQNVLWEKHERSFVALAGLEWQILMRAFRSAKANLDAQNYMEISYEDFCQDPLGICDRVIDFCGLEPSARLQAALSNTSFKDMNYRWKEELTPRQQEILEDILAEDLTLEGYGKVAN